jgi:hypothetical protein
VSLAAFAREQGEWIRAGVVAAAFRGGNPMRFVPPCYRPGATGPVKKSAAEVEVESRMAWAALDAWFGKKR